jgi:hypothetical protein
VLRKKISEIVNLGLAEKAERKNAEEDNEEFKNSEKEM